MKRRLLFINPVQQQWQLATLQVDTLQKDPREDYFTLSGEPLCQYLLRQDRSSLVIARGPLPFLSGNKATVGFISPLTELPHYSFVGGRAAAQLFNLGLDGICLRLDAQRDSGEKPPLPIIVLRGRAPSIEVTFRHSTPLPTGQRSAYYWLLEEELDGDEHAGSIFTIGEGARYGYRSANLAVDAIYHAGRGGAGVVFSQFASALVLSATTRELSELLPHTDPSFLKNPNRTISLQLERYCSRLSRRDGGTITKLFTTGAAPDGKNSLPSNNAQEVGYSLADLGSPRILRATRKGQTGCHWCSVDCRHYHSVPADYAPDGVDRFLDDFEPTYSIFAMLGLSPAANTLESKLDLLANVDKRVIMPIEEMGCDVVDAGTGLAALFEGAERGLIPSDQLPEFVSDGGMIDTLEKATRAVGMLRTGAAAKYKALYAVGDGPQRLAELFPAMQDVVFTGGKGTLGNAGHANALWTFLMPFSRFFGHYVGQIYRIDEELPPPDAGDVAHRACFARVVQRMLQREFYWVLGNALSMCAFTFVIFSQDGQGEQLSEDGLLVSLLHEYGIDTTRADLEWFAQAFWCQSIDMKCQSGWHPPSAKDFPHRVYETLSLTLKRTPDELQSLMTMLIEEWRRQASWTMRHFGYQTGW
ncbi:MAG: hypothetical protein MUQ10_04565 [Anaerolineae bacterium]|nr:hypothetical protein [Anaerolineae bacterium]